MKYRSGQTPKLQDVVCLRREGRKHRPAGSLAVVRDFRGATLLKVEWSEPEGFGHVPASDLDLLERKI